MKNLFKTQKTLARRKNSHCMETFCMTDTRRNVAKPAFCAEVFYSGLIATYSTISTYGHRRFLVIEAC